MFTYTITPQTHCHQWQVLLTFDFQCDTPLILKLANWVAGSYMIRDFAKNIMTIQATCDGCPIELVQRDKNTWQLPEKNGRYCIRYTVYANDLSVRASLLDNERGFIDGSCLFLYSPEHTSETMTVIFQDLPEDWRIQTTLPEIAPNTFQAACYAELVDHPMELGANLEVLHFEACGIPHRIAISGYYADFDRTRFIQDCITICEHEIRLFKTAPPFNEYLFLLHLGDNIYGGLEHRNSTALHADRNTLPEYGMGEADADYTTLLGLIAHEYFHAWNVKSIKPTLFQPYDLDKEVYTEQLWAYEGITSYYDDLTLVRSGVISVENYLNLLAKTLTRVQRTLGRQHQTLAQSSFTAWTKYYQQDENSPNAIVSYYQQGALMALCLDAHIRQHSDVSLDFVMQQLYVRYQQTGQGTAEQEWQQLAQTFTQLDLNGFFQAALYSTQPLPLKESLQTFGITLTWLPENRQQEGRLVNELPYQLLFSPQPDIACRCKQHEHFALITHVFNDGAAEQAGLKAGDKIIAVNRFACTNLFKQTQTAVGDQHCIHYFRQGVLQQTTLTVQAAQDNCAFLQITDKNKLNQWLFQAA